MSTTRVFEDIDLPGEGNAFYVEVLISLVDAVTKEPVREAYHDGKTITGIRRAPIDGGAPNWTNWTAGIARSQWELRLPPNSEINYRGTLGGTYWKRQVSGRGPWGYFNAQMKKSVAYIDVPVSDDRLIFGNLVAPDENDMPTTTYTWNVVAGDLWSHTLRFQDPDPDDPTILIPTDMTGYTMELELRRSLLDSEVRALATFDYTDAAIGLIGMKLTSADTAPLFGTYIGSIQQYDTEDERTTLDTWTFVFQRDR